MPAKIPAPLLPLSLLLLLPSPSSSVAESLGSWNIDQDKITVSGLSAGGAFATQVWTSYN